MVPYAVKGDIYYERCRCFEGWLSFRNRTEDTLNENIHVKPYIHSSLSLVWMI